MGSSIKHFQAMFVLASTILLFSYSSYALDLSPKVFHGERVLLAKGPFVKGDSARISNYLENDHNILEVHLHSNGGLFSEGIGVGNALRKASVITRVTAGGVCVSACVWAFLGGRIRYVDERAKIGVHMASVIFNEKLISRIKKLLTERSDEDIDVPIRRVMAWTEKAAAKVAAQKAQHLVKMGVSLNLLAPGLDTDHWDVHWLTRSQIRSMNIQNVD